MRRPLLLLLPLLLVAILAAARSRAPASSAPDLRGLRIRVTPGDGAAVPADLAAAMAGWPELAPLDPDEVELGRLLFFDPVLSGSDTVSCASCHQPDLGFTDARERSVGVSGEPTRRNAPTLWNVGLKEQLNWDGRSPTLEAQLLGGPVIHPDEMAAVPDVLLEELREIPEYRRRFEALYGEVTLEGMAAAIAAFERSLISRDSPFDRFAAGDYYALTGAQRRGLALFRSSTANCVACHTLPTFASDEFKIVGARDRPVAFDPGRGEITGRDGDVGAFMVPTLRNIALTAPYFHSGLEPDLVGAISFYINGGGDNLDVPRGRLSSELRPFDVPTRSLEDLEAFLLALTDESALPEHPTELPSGLSPVEPRVNPMREVVADAGALPPGPPRTHEVRPGQSVQSAIDRARPGDTVLLAPGRYFESLEIDVESLTLRGPGATLVGRQFTPNGITVRHNDVTIEGITLEEFGRFNIIVAGARGTTLVDVGVEGTRLSGELR